MRVFPLRSIDPPLKIGNIPPSLYSNISCSPWRSISRAVFVRQYFFARIDRKCVNRIAALEWRNFNLAIQKEVYLRSSCESIQRWVIPDPRSNSLWCWLWTHLKQLARDFASSHQSKHFCANISTQSAQCGDAYWNAAGIGRKIIYWYPAIHWLPLQLYCFYIIYYVSFSCIVL